VGQELLKKALILNVIDPNIGGVLIKGECGTAKSTSVRALTALLPEKDVVVGCSFCCDPNSPKNMCESCRSKVDSLKIAKRKMQVVELPVSATEDKVVGSLDISAAIKTGDKKFEPGILAKANGNILYVDEVNLLNDHIVDTLLDAAAMGINTVEREGVSFSHPSDFILVGTMNPEEGELRPQLFDRFSLCVYVEGIADTKSRITIIKRHREYLADPEAFVLKWSKQDKEISDKIVNARNILNNVDLTDPMLELIVNTCIDANVSGHRADIAMMNTSAAIAAYDGRKDVNENDVREAAILVLTHRTKNPPKYEPSKKNNNKDDDENNSNKNQNNKSKRDNKEESQHNNQDESKNDRNKSDSSVTAQFKAGEEFKIKSTAIKPVIKIDDIVRDSSGRRTETESTNGRYVSYRIPVEKPQSIALDATIRNAALKQKNRSGDVSIIIEPEDIMEKIRVRKSENLIVFVVDASGSMGAEQRMTAVKGSILSLLTDAYQKRDKICLITFRGNESTIIVPPTNNIDLAKAQMKDIPTGGKTPLGDGLTVAYDLIKREMNRDHEIKPIMVIISDGRGNSSISGVNPQEEISYISTMIVKDKICSIVLDSESGFVMLGFAKRLADMLNAKYLKLDTIRSDLKNQLAAI